MSETSPHIRSSQLIRGSALILSLLFGAYYVSDSLSGRDTGLAAQMRVLGFCPDAERASTSSGGSACSELVTLANLSGDLIPSVDNTFDIGSPTFRCLFNYCYSVLFVILSFELFIFINALMHLSFPSFLINVLKCFFNAL